MWPKTMVVELEDEDKMKSVRETEGNTDECTSRPESWGGRETDSGTI